MADSTIVIIVVIAGLVIVARMGIYSILKMHAAKEAKGRKGSHVRTSDSVGLSGDQEEQ